MTDLETHKLSQLLVLGFAQRQQGKTTNEDGQLLAQSSPHQLELVIMKVIKSMTVSCRELLTFVVARWHCGSKKKTAFLFLKDHYLPKQLPV